MLDRLQKTESKLQKARNGEGDEVEEKATTKQVIMSPEVVAMLDGID